jgi:hypothetical protein
VGILQRVRDTESSLEKVKRQLSSGSGRYLLQGPLLKRSETVCCFLAFSLRSWERGRSTGGQVTPVQIIIRSNILGFRHGVISPGAKFGVRMR